MSDLSSRVNRYGLYGCCKRGCDAVNPDYLSFGVGWPPRSYCLHHIPRRVRIRMWLWEKRATV